MKVKKKKKEDFKEFRNNEKSAYKTFKIPLKTILLNRDTTQPVIDTQSESNETQLVTENLITTLNSIDQSLLALNNTIGCFGESLTVYLKAINDELSYRNRHLG
jgi:hypothetical protein